MARMPNSKAQAKQDLRILLCSFMRNVKIALGVAILGFAPLIFAIPPNYPVTNTAVADYSIATTDFSVSAAVTVLSDPAAGNSPPYGVVLDSLSIAENLTAGNIGSLSVLDIDPTDTHTYTMSDTRFVFAGGVLQLAPGVSLDFEVEPSVLLTITAIDPAGASISQSFTITVLDVNEAPTDIALDNLTTEAATLGATVGLLMTTDPDSGDSHTYTVDDPRFEMVGNELKLLDTESLNLGEIVTIEVTSTDTGGLSIAETYTITSQAPGSGAGTNSSISINRNVPGGAGLPTPIMSTQCDAGGGFANLADPVSVFGQVLAMPGTHALEQTPWLKSTDAMFVRVNDVNANLDSLVIDQVDVVVTAASGDALSLRIFETAVDSGEFVGFVQTSLVAVDASDCTLQVSVGDVVNSEYTDPTDPLDTSVTEVAIDPFSLVFDSATGRRVDGAQITLVDANGTAASVFLDDGVTPTDNMAISGEQVAGSYRFPYVGSGSYVLNVLPPNRFRHPSVATDGAIQGLPDAPYALSVGSRGQVFSVPAGPIFQVDIPLDVVPITPTPSTITLLSADSTSPMAQTQFSPTSCFDGQGFVSRSTLNTSTTGPMAVPAILGVVATSRFARGDAVLIQVTDLDQDLDPFAPDQLEVVISVNDGLDLERLLLTETGDSTGIFTGFIQISQETAPSTNSCELEGDAHSSLEVTYQDPADSADSSTSGAIFDPVFRVFASDTGALLNGAEITIVDAVTGAPAIGAVFAVDGATSFPTTVTSGEPIVDGAGETHSYGEGAFNFPVLAPGSYRLSVVPPTSYLFPSTAADEQLAQLSGTFTVTSGSRGLDFVVAAGVLPVFDVPLDPASVDVFVTKEASKETVSVGDFLQYRIGATSSSVVDSITQARLVDRLPTGFRYVADSLRINEVAAESAISIAADGETLTLQLGQIDPGTDVIATYVVEVTAGADNGMARNQVDLLGVGVGESNRAFADVFVKNDLFTDTTFIVGRVALSSCDVEAKGSESSPGIGGVRIMLEDGTFVVTDIDGKYHFQDVKPGTHVVQLDTATLPIGLVPKVCEETTAHAGSAISQFVDLQAGALWRVDFGVEPDRSARQEASIELAVAFEDSLKVDYRVRVDTPDVELKKLRAMILLPDNATYVAGSALLNGAPVAEPRGIELGALNFTLPEMEGEADYELTFSATKAVAEISENEASKAVLMFEAQQPVAKSYRSEVAVVQHATGESAAQRLPMDIALTPRAKLPYTLPKLSKGDVPSFDAAFLIAHQQERGIVFPRERYNPVMPAIPVAVVHPTHLRPHLLVDGELVSPLTLSGTVSHKVLGLSLTTWDGVPISESDSTIELQLEEDGVDVVLKDTLAVHFSGAPVRAEFLADRSYLVADGLHPPALAVRLYDRAGFPLRAGTTGEFSVGFPYQSLNQTKHLENLNNEFTNHTYRVLEDGIAYIQLEPTVQTGEVDVKFRFDAVRNDSIRARLAPGQREWIMVGLLEGSFSEREFDGQKRSLEEANLDVERDGRFAFYAKGTVKGEWLLTVAYDTDKEFSEALYEQIDPNQYYTLYGDGTDQLHDAQSQQKLYLKVERGRFASLFGDFDTEFQKSKLARYERRLNGIKTGYYGRRWEAKAWVSDTAQGFVHDEIPGDGTSGVYRLSQRNLVRNSELVKIVTRDRFSPSEVVAENALSRYQDYSIDYERGTLIFREPVLGQDEQFNPVFVDVEYEVDVDAQQELVGGARVAYRLDDQDSEVAVTYVRDENSALGGELVAADLTWQFNEQQKLTVEYAESERAVEGRGTAYLLELEHNGKQLAGRTYVREQEASFGLGHQSAFERGVRQVGIEGELHATDVLTVRAQAFEQTLLDQGTDRLVAETQLEYQRGTTQLRGGARTVDEQTLEGEADATQVTMGITQDMLNNKLAVRVDGEIDVSSKSENSDYPNRAVLGAEYRLFNDVTLIGEHELSFSDLRDTQDSRIGLRAKPWQGADVHTMLNRRGGEQGERLFATTGVMQQWRVSETWLLDFGFDQVNTFDQTAEVTPQRLTYNAFNPTASGSVDDDYNAYYIGAGYQKEAWSISSRLERHQGDEADKWNFLAGANRQLAEGRVISGSVAVLQEELAIGNVSNTGDLRFGMAWRPAESPFTYLSRTDLVYDKRQNGLFDTTTHKFINNTAVNYRPNERHQLSVNLGFKYTQDEIDGEHYSGRTALLGAEYRYHFLPRWDVGLHASSLRSLDSHVEQYSLGGSIGFRAFKNSWLSVGYNVTGFTDDDFVGADYSAEGIFIKFRIKFDQLGVAEFLEFAKIKPERQLPHANGG